MEPEACKHIKHLLLMAETLDLNILGEGDEGKFTISCDRCDSHIECEPLNMVEVVVEVEERPRLRLVKEGDER